MQSEDLSWSGYRAWSSCVAITDRSPKVSNIPGLSWYQPAPDPVWLAEMFVRVCKPIVLINALRQEEQSHVDEAPTRPSASPKTPAQRR